MGPGHIFQIIFPVAFRKILFHPEETDRSILGAYNWVNAAQRYRHQEEGFFQLTPSSFSSAHFAVFPSQVILDGNIRMVRTQSFSLPYFSSRSGAMAWRKT